MTKHDPLPMSSTERRSAVAVLIAKQLAPPPAPQRAPEPPPEAGAPSVRPGTRGWVQLSAAEAARHPLYGVGGWLNTVALLVALGLIRALIELSDFWATTDHGGLAAWIMAVLRSAMAAWAALILVLLFARSRAFPVNFTAYSVLNVIYLALFGLAFAHVTQGTVFAGVAVGVVVTLVAAAYVALSRRVNVTYLRRVRAREARQGG
jgi:hypothetical protein